jgi:hypothetical protein
MNKLHAHRIRNLLIEISTLFDEFTRLRGHDPRDKRTGCEVDEFLDLIEQLHEITESREDRLRVIALLWIAESSLWAEERYGNEAKS